MEKYKRMAQLMCELWDSRVRAEQFQLDTYRDVLLEIEGASCLEDLWAYLDVEKKKATTIRDGCPSYDEWEEAKNRLNALEYAEKWLHRLEDIDGE